MNKLAILLVSAMLMFAGCQNSDTDGNNNSAVSLQDNRQGILQSLGGASNSAQATHLLRMDDGKTIFLKSDKINLEDQKYKGKLVELTGNLLEKVEGKDVMEVLTIDLIEEEENALTSDEIPEWEDYDSSELGIGLKYRNDYELEKDENLLTLSKKAEVKEEDEESINVELEEENAEINFILYSEEKDLISFLELPGDSMTDLSGKGFNKSKVGVNSVEALKRIDGDKIEYFMSTDKGVLKIEFLPGEEENKNSDQNMFYDVLASLKVYNVNNVGELETENDGAVDENDTSVDLTGHANPEDMEGEDEPVEEDKQDGELDDQKISDVPGYEVFNSDGYKFSMVYPKSYYFGSEGGSYNFSSEPLEEENAEINIKLELNTGSFPEGKSIPSETGTEIVKIIDGDEVFYYVEGANRVYKLSGSANEDTKMMIMAQSIQD